MSSNNNDNDHNNLVLMDLAVWLAFPMAMATVVVSFLYVTLVFVWGPYEYKKILNSPKTKCDIDAFVGPKNPVNAFKVAAAHRFRMGWRVASTTPIPLECIKSPHVEGLYVSRRRRGGTKDKDIPAVPLEELLPRVNEQGNIVADSGGTKKPTVIVATIRMGFGHHRLAYSACSWSLANGYTTIFHDLLNIDSDESQLLVSVDELYSKFSRLASEWGGPVERLWGMAMKQGTADALRIAALTTAHLQPLLLSYPKDIPMICTHQTVALTAAAIGFTNVVNLVVDNYPQWFLVVPGQKNLVQGPVNYQSFLRMGVPAPEQLKLAGHWCPTQLVTNIPEDCATRMARAQQGFGSSTTGGGGGTIAPRRILIPVGGAGAQRSFILKFVQALTPLVQKGTVQLFLNAGDHKHMKTAFMEQLAESKLDYDMITTTQGVRDFQAALLVSGKNNKEPTTIIKGITLFAFDEYFPAVATTDILCRVSDVMACKPSELAFYPIPKLHLRRVGDHEADSARRSSELGDGTMEAREMEECMECMELFTKSSEWLVQMNQQILQNHTLGIYSGCQRAVTWVVSSGDK